MKAVKTVKVAKKTKPAEATPAIEAYASVWDPIADTPEQAANLQARSALMRQIAAIADAAGWTQAEAAGCGVTQPRMNDLLRGRLSRFSLDALVKIAAALGQRVHVELQAAKALCATSPRLREIAGG